MLINKKVKCILHKKNIKKVCTLADCKENRKLFCIKCFLQIDNYNHAYTHS